MRLIAIKYFNLLTALIKIHGCDLKRDATIVSCKLMSLWCQIKYSLTIHTLTLLISTVHKLIYVGFWEVLRRSTRPGKPPDRQMEQRGTVELLKRKKCCFELLSIMFENL